VTEADRRMRLWNWRIRRYKISIALSTTSSHISGSAIVGRTWVGAACWDVTPRIVFG